MDEQREQGAGEWRQRAERAEAEARTLREALEFYARAETYKLQPVPENVKWAFLPVKKDSGERARAALAQSAGRTEAEIRREERELCIAAVEGVISPFIDSYIVRKAATDAIRALATVDGGRAGE